MRSNLIDIEVIIVRDDPSDKAIKVRIDEGAPGVWLPRSMIEITPSNKAGRATVTMTEDFATDKGLT